MSRSLSRRREDSSDGYSVLGMAHTPYWVGMCHFKVLEFSKIRQTLKGALQDLSYS
jgi:hypothetical protein